MTNSSPPETTKAPRKAKPKASPKAEAPAPAEPTPTTNITVHETGGIRFRVRVN